MFTGFPREMPAFFAAIRVNNNREFFEDNRAMYEHAVHEPLLALAEALAPTVYALDPQLDTRPVRAVSRIHRDVRFRKDKSPFRDYMWIGYRRTGEQREQTCGFYFDVSDTAANFGCGYYHMMPEVMDKLRERIVQNPKAVLTIVNDPAFLSTFELRGESYARTHQPPDSVPIELRPIYQKKNVYAEHSIKDLELLFSPNLADQVAERFQALAPFYGLLRGCMEAVLRE